MSMFATDNTETEKSFSFLLFYGNDRFFIAFFAVTTDTKGILLYLNCRVYRYVNIRSHACIVIAMTYVFAITVFAISQKLKQIAIVILDT